MCKCAQDYSGRYCDTQISASKVDCPKGCSNHGTCVAGTCECEATYGGDDCAQRVCSVDGPGDCSGHGTCKTGESFFVVGGQRSGYCWSVVMFFDFFSKLTTTSFATLHSARFKHTLLCVFWSLLRCHLFRNDLLPQQLQQCRYLQHQTREMRLQPRFWWSGLHKTRHVSGKLHPPRIVSRNASHGHRGFVEFLLVRCWFYWIGL